MSYTSAQSGDNYRNWWPHPVMTAFTDASIDELDRFAHESGDVFHMTRGGYALATRSDDISAMQQALQPGIDVEVYAGGEVRERFPALSPDIRHAIHIRRGGDISGQQLGAWMLDQVRAAGGRLLRGAVTGIDKGSGFTLEVTTVDGARIVTSDALVNCAGPFANRIAKMLDEDLPVRNVFEQKVAFDDRLSAIPRDMPFSIDLDAKQLGWMPEELELLVDDPDLAWLAGTMPGGTHCRPEGGPQGSWVKLGWAYNNVPSEPQEDLANEPAADPQFPEIVMRGAAAFIPSLAPYVEEPPTRYSHYGGYYTMTDENWPLIGPMQSDGAYMIAALSGFGSMSACAAGKLCANWMCGSALPDYALPLSMLRYDDPDLMQALSAAASKGLL